MVDFKCTIPPWLCNTTRPQQTLQMFADHYSPRHTILWNTIKQGLLQLQGELYPSQPLLTIATRINSSSFVRVSMRQLAVNSIQENFKHTRYSWEHWYWQDTNPQPLAPQASVVSIELTWQLNGMDSPHKMSDMKV